MRQRLRGSLGVMLAIVCLALASCLHVTRAYAMTGVPYGEIVATHSGKCVNVQNGSTSAGAAIIQWDCVRSTNETWQVEPAATTGYYQVISQRSGLCLAIPAGSAQQLVQTQCAASAYQFWSIVPQTTGGYQLMSLQTGDCMSVSGASQADLAPVIHAACGTTLNFVFQFEQTAFVAGAAASIMSQNSGQCASLDTVSAAKGANAIQYPCGGGGGISDTWTLHPAGAGMVNLVNVSSGLCLDVSGASQAAGGPVILWPCSGAINQNWSLQAYGNAWRLVAQHSGQCLNVMGGSLQAVTILVQMPCVGNKQELWSFHTPALQANWTAPVPTLSVAVAAANLPNGKVLSWSSDGQTSFGNATYTFTEVLDPVKGTDAEYLVTNTSYNMFCPGIANLPDGRVFVNGGDTNGDTSIYDPVANAWSSAAQMNVGRAYQGTVLDADGTVFTLGGSWRTATQGVTPGEVWNAASGWKLLSGIPSNPVWTADTAGPYRADNHLWLHVLSGGRLLHAGPSATMHWIGVAGGGGLGSIASAGARGSDGDSMNGNASAYDVDMLLKVGGAPNYDNSTATANAVVINASGSGNPVVTSVAPMEYARGFGNSVVLPNGHVVIVGGQTFDEPFTDTDAVLVAEIWDPVSQVFERLPPMATPRTYHSTALLLPDGRVWVGGGGLCGTGCGTAGANHTNYEILTPPYLLTANGAAATRPVINSVNAASFAPGAAMTIVTQGPVEQFALMRLSSVTHTVNNDQRRIPLATTTTDGVTYHATLSADTGVLVAGYYMLFALDARGVPSMAYTLQIT